jgi:replication fork protection complex subunit Tof1/Swi1
VGVDLFALLFLARSSPRKPRRILCPTRSLARAIVNRIFFFFPDADELEWYIPAGINLPDLQLPLTVIEQFEKSPLDLNGKRASQLLQKRRRRRRRRRRQPSSSDSDPEGGNSDSDAPRKAARKARERETYKSAQFIEDSEEEYERDIDAFFAREAELRKRTALSAASVLVADASTAADGQQGQEQEQEQRHRHLGTMRATGTKKRRRAQPARGTSAAPKARAAKRRAVVSLSGTPGKDGEGEHGGINAAAAPRRSPSSAASFDDDDDDDDGGGGGDGGDSGDDGAQRSSIDDRDVGRHRHSDSLEVPRSHRPRARPLYRRGTSLRASPAPDATPSMPGADGGEEEDDDAMGPRPSVSSLRVTDEDDLTRQTKGGGGGGGGSGGGSSLRKGRLIISDEEE